MDLFTHSILFNFKEDCQTDIRKIKLYKKLVNIFTFYGKTNNSSLNFKSNQIIKLVMPPHSFNGIFVLFSNI